MSIEPEDILEISLTRQLKELLKAGMPSTNEARHLVDLYYQMQEFRITSASRSRQSAETEEPSTVAQAVMDEFERLENGVRVVLLKFAESQEVGRWSLQTLGIGPVISAGLLAHIDITKAPTAGHIYAFAGIDGEKREWGKGQKRPWNAQLKTLCAFKIGESFVKVSGREKSLYGRLYKERKLALIEANERGDFSKAASAVLEIRKIGKQTEAYKAYSVGKLPPAHVHARARRYAAKIFLAHWHEEAFRVQYGKHGPTAYAIEHLGHVHEIAPEIPYTQD